MNFQQSQIFRMLQDCMLPCALTFYPSRQVVTERERDGDICNPIVMILYPQLLHFNSNTQSDSSCYKTIFLVRYVVMTYRGHIKDPCFEFLLQLLSLPSEHLVCIVIILYEMLTYYGTSLVQDLLMKESSPILFLHWSLAKEKYTESFFTHQGQQLGQVH